MNTATMLRVLLAVVPHFLIDAAYITKSKAEWQASVGGSFTTETFNNLDDPPGDNECDSYLGDFTGLVVGQITVDYLNSNPDFFRICGRSHSVTVGPINDSVYLNPSIDDDDGIMAWTFSEPINAVGFDVKVSNSEPLDIHLVNDPDDFADVRVNSDESFVGIVFESSFNETVYLINPNSFFDVQLAIDNVVWSSNGAIPPTPAPVATPTPAPPTICFSEETKVQAQGRGEMPIGEVKLGDLVLAKLPNHYSRVYSLAHRSEDLYGSYFRLEFWSHSAPLEISADHMIATRDRGMVPSKALVVGDVLVDEDIVTRITQIRARGLYAPLTEAGTIVVNGKLASNYVALLHDAIPFQHWIAHAVVGWRRLLQPTSEERTLDGYAEWTLPTLSFAYWLRNLAWGYQLLFVVAGSPVLLLTSCIQETALLVILVAMGFLGYKIVWCQKQAQKGKQS